MKPLGKCAIPLLSALSLGAAFTSVADTQGYGPDPGCSRGLLGREEQDLANHMARRPVGEWSPGAFMHLRTLDACQLMELEDKVARIVDNEAAEAISALSSYALGLARRGGSGRSAEYMDRAVRDPDLYEILQAHVAYLQGDNAGLSKQEAVREIRQWAEHRKGGIQQGVGRTQGYEDRQDRSFPSLRQ